MLPILIGLESVLSDESCECVTLSNSSSGASRTYARQEEGEAAWTLLRPGPVRGALVPEDAEPVHSSELADLIQRGMGTEHDRVECLVGAEKVSYAFEKGRIRVARETRTPQAGPARRRDLEVSGRLVEALGIPRSARAHKLKQAVDFAALVLDALAADALAGESDRDANARRELSVLDLACGRSYLGFVLTELLAARGWRVALHGVDSGPALVAKCDEIRDKLGWTNCVFEAADLSKFQAQRGKYRIMVALHACDTLTDRAIRIAHEAGIERLFVAPCCHHELRFQMKSHPLEWIARYGLLEQRLADVLTDGFRCLVLESLGYRVKVHRFTSAAATPKNVLIAAERLSGPGAKRPSSRQSERFADLCAFLETFHVRPELSDLARRCAKNEA